MTKPANGIKENLFALLKHVFADYAVQLRAEYPGRKIRNAAVLASGIPEFARLGYIELVDARKKVPEHILDHVAHRIQRARQPIWVPGKNFPHNPLDLRHQMLPYMRGNEVLWRHVPSRSARQARTK